MRRWRHRNPTPASTTTSTACSTEGKEIDATHRLCDVIEIASGDVMIDGATAAEQLARYAQLRVILGALTIRDVATVDLPALELVGGGLLVGGTTAHVAAPPTGHHRRFP